MMDMKLIRGEYIPQLADKVLIHYDRLMCNPHHIEDGDTVYCDTHHIMKFKDILNTKKDLTIITHNSDHCLYDGDHDDRLCVNVDELNCYSRWFGQSVYSEKVIPIPIGFENTRWEKHFGPKTEMITRIRKQNAIPSKIAYLNCSIQNGVEARQECYDKSSKMSFVTIDQPNLTYSQYLDRMKDHMFILGPRGNGLDSHRTWETLMLRRVPVLTKKGRLEELYNDLPVLFVDDWNDLNEMNLQEVYESFSFDNQDYLTMEYWEEKIKEVVSN